MTGAATEVAEEARGETALVRRGDMVRLGDLGKPLLLRVSRLLPARRDMWAMRAECEWRKLAAAFLHEEPRGQELRSSLLSRPLLTPALLKYSPTMNRKQDEVDITLNAEADDAIGEEGEDAPLKAKVKDDAGTNIIYSKRNIFCEFSSVHYPFPLYCFAAIACQRYKY